MREPGANDQTGYVFTDQERERLLSFRAAIAAGLYGDGWMDEAAPCCDDLRLPDFSIAPDSLPYPFTARQLATLAVYKAAVDAGFYNEGDTPKARSLEGVES